MPIQEVEALILLDPRLDRQAIFNAGKVAEKLCEEKKHCVGALLDIAAGDTETLYKHIMNSKKTGELGQTMSKLAIDVGQANLIDKDSNGQIFLSGYNSAIKIREFRQHIDEAAKALEKPTVKMRSKSKMTRRYHLHLRGPGNGCAPGRAGKIMNKPEQNMSNWDIFNRTRGGSQEVLLDIEALNSERNFNKIIRKIYHHRKWIVFAVLTGFLIYISFKKPKFAKKFINGIKKLFKPFHRIYKRISNHWIINNRFTTSVLLFHRVVNRI